MEQIIGYVAATLTTASFLPQVYQILKTKDTSSISLSMYIIFCLGVFLWLVFGILKEEAPIIIANAITLFLGLLILTLKLKEKK